MGASRLCGADNIDSRGINGFVVNGLDWLPSWTYPESVKKLADKRNAEESGTEPVAYGNVAGLAVLWALVGTGILWTTSVILAVVSIYFSYCLPSGGAQYPLWLWFMCLPVLVVSLAIELRCLSYTLVPRIQVLGQFKLFGLHCNFALWICLMLFMSLNAHLNGITDALFLGTAWRSGHCEMASAEEKSLPFKALLAYLLSFCRLLYALVGVTPVWSEWGTIDYIVCWNKGRPCRERFDNGVWIRGKMQYATLIDERQNHAMALVLLSGASSMMSIAWDDLDYAKRKAEIQLAVEQPDYVKVGHHVTTQVQRATMMVFFNGILCDCLQLYLQIAEFNKHPQIQLGFSIVMSLSSSALTALSASKILHFCWTTRRLLNERMQNQKQDGVRPREAFLLFSFVVFLLLSMYLFGLFVNGFWVRDKTPEKHSVTQL